MTKRLVEELKRRGIRAMVAVPLPGGDYPVALSMSAADTERFLNVVAPPPWSGEDPLPARVMGRPQDLTAREEPWRFEVYPTVILGEEDWLSLRVSVNIPRDDVREVYRRLGLDEE